MTKTTDVDVTATKSIEAERMIARARAYALAGQHLLDFRPGRTETEVEYDERYRLMNHLLDRAIALHPSPQDLAAFNPNYPNEEPVRRRTA